MNPTGKKLASRTRRPAPISPRLLAMEVGDYLLFPAARRSAIAPTMTRLHRRTGRRWRSRAMLRLDGTVRTLRIERIA